MPTCLPSQDNGNAEDLHVDKRAIFHFAPGNGMHHLALPDGVRVHAGLFVQVEWSDQAIQILPGNFLLAIAENLLKSRVASHDTLVQVEGDNGYRAIIHQSFIKYLLALEIEGGLLALGDVAHHVERAMLQAF